jgi:hypothetical protein
MTTSTPTPPAPPAKPKAAAPPPPPPPPPPPAPTHPRETSFTDLPAGQLNLIFVDITNIWSDKSRDASRERETTNIRKILLHHHTGFPHDLSEKHKTKKAASGEAVPVKFVDLATNAYKVKPYGYHYDIPYVGETIGGKAVVYVTAPQDRNVPHTAAGQNECGIGVSLVGTMRANGENPEGFDYSKTKPEPDEHVGARGLPSAHQRRVVPVLVRYLREQHNVAHSHVQGHFLHSKPACPGYDTERWLMDYEEKDRRAGRGFCYPVQIESGKGVPFLQDPTQELARAKKYMLNTRAGLSGFYPFTRRGFWHGGVHFFPPAGSPVYAVRDGWIIAARPEKNVAVDGKDYGSAAFVMVQHEDPGIWDGKLYNTIKQQRWNDKLKKWEPMTAKVAVEPTYFSLSMHLKPLDDSIPWVQLLKKKDPATHTVLFAAKDKTHTFRDIALPVKTGDIIGYVGTHDPFAALDKAKAVQNSAIYNNTSVLHFEVCSSENLVDRLESKATAKKWTLKDADENAMAEAATGKLKDVAGHKDHVKLLTDRLAEVEKLDPQHQDPSRFSGVLQDDLMEPLSTLITSHASEWSADWKTVLSAWHREMGLAQGGKEGKKAKAADDARIAKTVKHHLEMIESFKFGAAIRDYRNRALSGSEKFPHAYHPVRFLNWMNGLVRTPDAVLPYNTFDNVTPFDVSPRRVLALKPADQGDGVITIAKNTGKPEIKDPQKLTGTRIFFPPSREVHTVQKVTETKTALELTISPVLAKDLKKNDAIRLGGNGWRWEAKFPWETNILGVPAPTPAKGATP